MVKPNIYASIRVAQKHPRATTQYPHLIRKRYNRPRKAKWKRFFYTNGGLMCTKCLHYSAFFQLEKTGRSIEQQAAGRIPTGVRWTQSVTTVRTLILLAFKFKIKWIDAVKMKFFNLNADNCAIGRGDLNYLSVSPLFIFKRGLMSHFLYLINSLWKSTIRFLVLIYQWLTREIKHGVVIGRHRALSMSAEWPVIIR